MKRLIFCLIFLTAASAQAQSVTSSGGAALCKSPTGSKIAIACDAGGSIVGAAPTTAATFAALDVTIPGGIGPAYATVLDLPDGTKQVLLDNQTNGDVVISMDNGVSDTWSLKGGDVLAVNLAQFGLITTAQIAIKDGTSAATTGSFYISSFK